MGALAAFSVAQEAAIGVCEARKDAAVAIIDAHAAASAALQVSLKPRPWWALWSAP